MNCGSLPWGLQARTLFVRTRPFRHALVEDVFDVDTHARLESTFARRRDDSSSASRSRNYSAIIKALNKDDAAPFFPLLDPAWLRRISDALDLDATLEIDAALHSHPPGSRSGWIHNDFNPGWFAYPAPDGDVLMSESAGCTYKTGACAPEHEATKVQRLRYLTMIYYLGNDWRPGAGGETGIYDCHPRPLDQAAILVPPRNNSLLLFECSPHSWHTFLGSNIKRNSITLWLHRSVASAKSQWPYHEPVHWS